MGEKSGREILLRGKTCVKGNGGEKSESVGRVGAQGIGNDESTSGEFMLDGDWIMNGLRTERSGRR